MTANQAIILNKLDDTLSEFLRAYAVKRLDRITTEKRVEQLREIAFSNKPQYKNMDDRLIELEKWFEHFADEISRKDLSNESIQQLFDCIKQIELIGRGGSNSSREDDILFDRKRSLNVANMANAFMSRVTGNPRKTGVSKAMKIVRPPEEVNLPESNAASGDTVKEKFIDSLAYQKEVVDNYKDDKYHLFSIVDKLLDKLEHTPDIKASHMAASILYFMKLNGYMTAPYVEKLRKLNRNRND